jgi:hypothetical protein
MAHFQVTKLLYHYLDDQVQQIGFSDVDDLYAVTGLRMIVSETTKANGGRVDVIVNDGNSDILGPYSYVWDDSDDGSIILVALGSIAKKSVLNMVHYCLCKVGNEN